MEMELLEETKGKRNSLHKMPDFTRISNPHMISIHSENNQTKKTLYIRNSAVKLQSFGNM